jgi:hypothetical protein
MKTNRTGDFGESTQIVKALHIQGKRTLDLGCGRAEHTLPLGNVMLVDALKMDGAPDGVVIADIRKIQDIVGSQTFGTVYLLDVMEHLKKDEGVKLLKDLERFCERIVFFTPLGDLWVTDEDHPYSHKCGWLPSEAETLGYKTWSWPQFHKFADGSVHGAFWAWKDKRNTPDAKWVAKESGVKP